MKTKAKVGDAADLELALRVRNRRIQLGITQTELGEALGCSFQQVHKFESGINRYAVRHLVPLAAVLRTTVAALLGLEPGLSTEVLARSQGEEEMMCAYRALPHSVRPIVRDLARSLAS